ncbi:MAG TPA: CDGSH iron-sulfur domain-containing protein [Pseudonocardiaceae bacterium]|nr:CDGSH iron-sulfur domain-containing protein [Pseudonocardiaceae bacterium]
MSVTEGVAALRAAVSALRATTDNVSLAQRLADSVLRPLDGLLDEPPGPSASVTPWELAVMATRLAVAHPGLPALMEATAALQDVACEFEDPATVPGRLDELRALQAGLDPGIRLAHNGPYLVTNAENLRDSLGCGLPTRPQLALCRCGASERKPYCDGSHARVGFTDGKSPDRVPDHRETYVGQQVTVYDNRGVCQHSGLCTDRLATVFRQGRDPFVAPSGGRMDEIVRAVRDCPSGALSYGIDGFEERAAVNHHNSRPATIQVTRDGPYRVTGGLPLRDSDGADVARAEGSSREHYALCRCGQSQNKPFCSGMHYYVDFRDPVVDADVTPTMFEWCGGLPALVRMTRLFYEKYVPQDPILAPLFATMSADHPERVAAWLGEVFGGPKNYSDGYGGYPRMLSQHRGKGLTEEMRGRWVELLLRSAHDAGLPNDAEFRSAFQAYIEWGSRLAVENSQTQARPPEHMPMPHWGWNTASGPPGSRLSALAVTEEKPAESVVLPAAGEQVGFDRHVRPLFRSHDRQSMRFAFDLWSVDDVRTHGDAILARLVAGSMPCDGAWPQERIDVFERWLRTGTAD